MRCAFGDDHSTGELLGHDRLLASGVASSRGGRLRLLLLLLLLGHRRWPSRLARIEQIAATAAARCRRRRTNVVERVVVLADLVRILLLVHVVHVVDVVRVVELGVDVMMSLDVVCIAVVVVVVIVVVVVVESVVSFCCGLVALVVVVVGVERGGERSRLLVAHLEGLVAPHRVPHAHPVGEPTRHEEVERSRQVRRKLAGVMQVQHEHGEHNGHGGERHGGGQVDADERHHLARLRYVLGHEQHEDREGEQHRDAERHLLATIGRQPEADQTQHREPNARQDDVEQVVEDAASHEDAKRHVRKGLLRTARIVDHVAHHLHAYQVPLARLDVVAQVGGVRQVGHVHLQARVRPRAELENAHLETRSSSGARQNKGEITFS